MLISYNWLKKFITTNRTAQEIADKLTLSLTEVENINKIGDDYILEIENKGLTHRPDCFSHLGVAREVAAYFKLKLNDPLQSLIEKRFSTERKMPFSIEVKEKQLCPRYCGVVLTNIKVAPSPNWLKTALERLDQNSINNVVDITNYVMFELGQPLHAFDYEKVKNHKIVVRKSKKGEKLVTLDDEARELDETMLVIADSKKPIGLAGVKGGKNTQVTNDTKTIILEAANFDAKNNRKTSKKINLRTDASTRFEKNLDITLPPSAIKKTIELLQKYAGAKVASEIVDILNKPFKHSIVSVKTEWINNFIGFNVSDREMISILNSLGFQTSSKNGHLKVNVPSWRQDVSMKADIAEEIARVYGYDKIPITLPQLVDKPPKTNSTLLWRKKAKLFFKGLRFTEVHTQPFIGKKMLEKYGMSDKKHLQLVNPLTIDQEFMRRSLIPSLLEVAKDNLKHDPKLKIFEIDRVFIPRKNTQPNEIFYLAGIAKGENFPNMKGTVEALLDEFAITKYKFKPAASQFAELFIDNNLVGIIQKEQFNLNFDKLIEHATTLKKYKPIPKFPPLIEDMTFSFPPKTYIGPVIEKIKSTSKLIKKVEILDQYKNNFTFRITYQSRKKSLSSSDIKDIRKKITFFCGGDHGP